MDEDGQAPPSGRLAPGLPDRAPQDPWDLVNKHLATHTNTLIHTTHSEPIGPALDDTRISADEGPWTRKGWVGRA